MVRKVSIPCRESAAHSLHQTGGYTLIPANSLLRFSLAVHLQSPGFLPVVCEVIARVPARFPSFSPAGNISKE
jgi:hypothetical protein